MITPLSVDLIYNHRDAWTLKLTGSVDITNHHQLEAIYSDDSLVSRVVETQARKFVIDLTDVERLDSQGIRELYIINTLFDPTDIQLFLKNPNSHLHRLLQIMHFDKIFDIELDD